MPREKSNSITHLVKIVAQEVFNERFKHIEYLIDKHHERLMQLELDKRTTRLIDHSHILNEIKSNLEQAGQYWSKNEDQLLKDEVSAAISTIANSHGRSKSAIVSRIFQKELIRKHA